MRYRTVSRRRAGARTGLVVAAMVSLALLVSGCASGAVGGNGTYVKATAVGNVPASKFKITGDGGTNFDQLARNALVDVQSFWTKQFPTIDNGKALKPLSGGVFSVTTNNPNTAEKCMAEEPKAANNNAFYCSLDDAFAYDRTGLVKIVADQLGPNFVPLVFAHEYGHMIQNRLGIQRVSILMESQADCASGAFMAAEAGVGKVSVADPHFTIDPKTLDQVALGMILLRDYSVHSSEDQGSHGNGFDRLSAFSDGFTNGAAYCYSSNWTARKFTERSYTSATDQENEGNESLAQVLDADPPSTTGTTGGGGLQPALNAYWTRAFKSINKTFKPVKIKQASTPPCDAETSNSPVKFGYCASDNTVYYDYNTASQAYNSMVAIEAGADGSATVAADAPADYLLGNLFAYGWGMAVRSQLGLSTDSTAALLGASCYAGAFAESINVPATKTATFTLSPQDMDEASVAVMLQVPKASIFGARNTTAFERIASFKKGYFGTVTACT